MVRNIGGGAPGGIDRATLGHVGKQGFCFAEDEAGSPWNSLAEERGFDRSQSTVTAFCGEGPSLVMDQLSRSPESLTRSLAASLRSAVETAARVTDPDQQRKLMSIIQDDVGRLDRLISDISDASRLDSELSRTHREPTDISGMLSTLTDVYATTATEGGPEVRLEIMGSQKLTVQGMDSRLVQVFRNLITNAMTFSPPGGTIRITAQRDRKTVVVTVDDDGPGIPPGKEEAIFQRFYTERPQGEKFGTHSGLGLSISQQIVKAHEGTILASNRLGADGKIMGARFTVTLPAA